MLLLNLVFGLRKTLNYCSAIGATLRMTTIFTKSQRAFLLKKMGQDNITLRYYYTGITQAISFHIFYHLCRDYLKPSGNFERINIWGESFWRILVNRAFHLNPD